MMNMMSPMHKRIRPRPVRKKHKSIPFLGTQFLSHSLRFTLHKRERRPNDLELPGNMMEVFGVPVLRSPDRFRTPGQTTLLLECFPPFLDPEAALHSADCVDASTCSEGSMHKKSIGDNIDRDLVDRSLSLGILATRC